MSQHKALYYLVMLLADAEAERRALSLTQSKAHDLAFNQIDVSMLKSAVAETKAELDRESLPNEKKISVEDIDAIDANRYRSLRTSLSQLSLILDKRWPEDVSNVLQAAIDEIHRLRTAEKTTLNRAEAYDAMVPHLEALRPLLTKHSGKNLLHAAVDEIRRLQAPRPSPRHSSIVATYAAAYEAMLLGLDELGALFSDTDYPVAGKDILKAAHDEIRLLREKVAMHD